MWWESSRKAVIPAQWSSVCQLPITRDWLSPVVTAVWRVVHAYVRQIDDIFQSVPFIIDAFRRRPSSSSSSGTSSLERQIPASRHLAAEADCSFLVLLSTAAFVPKRASSAGVVLVLLIWNIPYSPVNFRGINLTTKTGRNSSKQLFRTWTLILRCGKAGDWQKCVARNCWSRLLFDTRDR